MRPIPKIRFVKETEISKAAKIEELLFKAKQTDKSIGEVEKNQKD